MTLATDHPMRRMMIEQRESLIGQARLYHRWRKTDGLEPGTLSLFSQLESNTVQSIRALEEWLGFTKPWSPG